MLCMLNAYKISKIQFQSLSILSTHDLPTYSTTTMTTSDLLDPHFLTALGCALSIFLSAMGSAIGSAQGAIYAVNGPNMLAFVPIVTAGVLAIYGPIIAYLLLEYHLNDPNLSEVDGYKNFAAGLSVGLACLASGCGMANFVKQLNDGKCEKAPSGTAVAPASAESEPLLPASGTTGGRYGKTTFRKIILANIFLESIGLYGLIIALMLVYKKK